MTNNSRNMITKMQSAGVSQNEAFEFFDSLDSVSAELMIGRWKGSECMTGHPMDGLLTIAPWHGKEFVSAEEVHPLVMESRNGVLYSIAPKKVFRYAESSLVLKLASRIPSKHMLDPFMKLFRTKKSAARLREIVYRGKVTSAMVYDDLAIIDIFRMIDENTLLGVMDIKGRLGEKGYFFLLERE